MVLILPFPFGPARQVITYRTSPLHCKRGSKKLPSSRGTMPCKDGSRILPWYHLGSPAPHGARPRCCIPVKTPDTAGRSNGRTRHRLKKFRLCGSETIFSAPMPARFHRRGLSARIAERLLFSSQPIVYHGYYRRSGAVCQQGICPPEKIPPFRDVRGRGEAKQKTWRMRAVASLSSARMLTSSES